MFVDVEKFKKRDSVQAFLRETYKLVLGITQAPRPHIFCKDGFEMSVQAGDGLYCEPRANLESRRICSLRSRISKSERRAVDAVY